MMGLSFFNFGKNTTEKLLRPSVEHCIMGFMMLIWECKPDYLIRMVSAGLLDYNYLFIVYEYLFEPRFSKALSLGT